MKRKYSFFSAIHSNKAGLIFIALCTVIFLGTAIALNIWVGVPFEYLTVDITSLPDHVNTNIVYMGMISQIGLLYWFAASAISIFSAIFCSGRKHLFKFKWFFYYAGILSLILGFDDLFRGHETVYPLYLGIPENAVYAIYVFLMILFFTAFRKVILQTEYLLQLLAGTFFGILILQDRIFLEDISVDPFLIEDGAKFIGIISWFAYLFKSALHALRED